MFEPSADLFLFNYIKHDLLSKKVDVVQSGPREEVLQNWPQIWQLQHEEMYTC